MARVKVCRLCGVHNGPDELFCTGCGTSLADVAAVDESEIARAADAEEAEESAANVPDSGGGDGVPPVATAGAEGQTTREPSIAQCTLRFPWGRVPVAGQLGIGREAGFSLVSQQIDAYPTVSRQHAVIGLIQGQWTVRDLRSTNGTYVNGARLAAGETRTIGNGDRVGFSQGLQVEVEIGGGGTGGY